MDRYSGDMIVNLTTLPEAPKPAEGIKIKRAFSGEKKQILEFIRENFQENWAGETEQALNQCPSHCFLAVEESKILGFACYDSTAKGFFGPIGVHPDARGKKIGEILLNHTLRAMREDGYGYGIIGWVNTAEQFYRKTVNAEYIKGGEPENSVYRNLIHM